MLAFRLTHYLTQGRPVVALLMPMWRQEGGEVPAGFETDFFSIPWFVQWLFPVFGQGCEASVSHDYDCLMGVDKARRSARFRRACIFLGVARWKAWVMWVAVRFYPGSEAVSQPGAHRTLRPHA